MSQAYKFLANYHLTKKNWIDAYKYAQVKIFTFITSCLSKRIFFDKSQFFRDALTMSMARLTEKWFSKRLQRSKLKKKKV
jgi:hypothetical protein